MNILSKPLLAIARIPPRQLTGHRILAQLLLNTSCYCVAMLIRIEMRDAIFSFYIRSDETAIRAIAIVENDSIRGFNRSHIYSVERLEYSLDRLQKKDRNTNWRVKAMERTHTEGVSVRGLPARLEGEEGEEQFWFEGSKAGLMQISASGL